MRKGSKKTPEQLLFRHTDETKKKMSEMKKGAANPWFGKKHSPETLEKIRANLRIYRANRTYEIAHRTIKIPDREKLSYLAGIIDGEGSIKLGLTTKNNPEMYIYNCYEPLMTWIVNTFGGAYACYDKRGRTKNYQWSIKGARNVYVLLQHIKPFLIIKKHKSDLVEEFLIKKYGHVKLMEILSIIEN